MSWKTRSTGILIVTSLMLLLASCASINIKPPGPDAQSILILPFTAKNTSGSPYGYYYRYKIIKDGNKNDVYEANFTLPRANDFLVIDTLTSGTYVVSQITTHQVGTGRRDYDAAPDARFDEIKLVAGKISIFHNSLDITQKPYGVHRRWVSNYQIAPLHWEQRTEILKKLEKLENFHKWEVLQTNVTVQKPEGFRDYQQSIRPEYRAFATNFSSGRWGESWFSGTPKQAMDKALNFCEKTGQECTIYALGDNIVFGMSPAELLTALEEYYFSVSPMLARKNPELMIGNRISAEEIITLLSDTSVTGRTQNHLKYRATWKSNGEIIGEAIFLGNIERKSKDTGTWYVEDGKLCRQWGKWSGGRLECLVVTKEGDQLYAYDLHVDMIEEISFADEE